MRVHLPIKTAMEERQARERERYMRPIARAASGDCKMSFYITPYQYTESVPVSSDLRWRLAALRSISVDVITRQCQ